MKIKTQDHHIFLLFFTPFTFSSISWKFFLNDKSNKLLLIFFASQLLKTLTLNKVEGNESIQTLHYALEWAVNIRTTKVKYRQLQATLANRQLLYSNFADDFFLSFQKKKRKTNLFSLRYLKKCHFTIYQENENLFRALLKLDCA